MFILLIPFPSSHLDLSVRRKQHPSHLLRDPALWPGQTGGIRQASLQGTIYCGIILSSRTRSTGKTVFIGCLDKVSRRSFALFFLISFFSSTSTHYCGRKTPQIEKGSLKKRLLTTKYPSPYPFFFFFVPLPVAGRSLRPSLFVEHDIFIHSSKPILRRLGHIPL